MHALDSFGVIRTDFDCINECLEKLKLSSKRDSNFYLSLFTNNNINTHAKAVHVSLKLHTSNFLVLRILGF